MLLHYFYFVEFFLLQILYNVSNMLGALHLNCHEQRADNPGFAYHDASTTVPSQAGAGGVTLHVPYE